MQFLLKLFFFIIILQEIDLQALSIREWKY